MKKILILLESAFSYRNFNRAIDHTKYDVCYIGTKENLLTIPADVKCHKEKIESFEALYEEAINTFGDHPSFDHILAPWEMGLLTAAKLRQAWNIAGPKPDQVEKVRDKVLMKEALRQFYIKVPHFEKFRTSIDNKGKTIGSGKLILKPVSEAASRGVMIFDSFSEAFAHTSRLDKDIKNLFIDTYQVEEYIDSSIFHIDGLVVDHKLACYTVGMYVGTNFDYSQGIAMGSTQTQLGSEIKSWADKVVEALDIKQGAIHLEFFYNEGQDPIFMEIANRCGGGPFVREFELKTGVYLPAAEISLYLNDFSKYDWKNHLNISPHLFAGFVFPGHHLPDGYPVYENLEVITKNPHIEEFSVLPKSSKLPRNITYDSSKIPIGGILKSDSTGTNIKLMKHFFESVSVSSKPE